MIFKKKDFIFIVVSVIFILGLTGCQLLEDDKTEFRGEGNIKLVIDWEEFGRTEKGISSLQDGVLIQEKYKDISHVGARIEYPKYGGTWSQYVEKKTAEEKGVITFKIPAAKEVSLYVGAVNFSESRALWFGVDHEVTIPEDTIVEITMEDINWVKAKWKFDEEDRILVREPFHEHIDDIPYSDSFVGISGTANIHENVDGWRIFTGQGEPFFRGDYFSLPRSTQRYRIPKK